jgi:hypothetical protein
MVSCFDTINSYYMSYVIYIRVELGSNIDQVFRTICPLVFL